MNKLRQVSPSYLPALTGLRALAAFAVYFCHFPLSQFIFGNWIWNFCHQLYISLSVFFVLSGFLITLRYKENFQKGHRDFKRYFIYRFARVFPLYFILTTITFILPYWFSLPPDNLSATSYLLNITLLKAFFKTYQHAGISQGWSLTVEETFYLLAPIFFIYANRIKYWMWIIILFATGAMLTAIFSRINFAGFFHDYYFTFISTFFGRCFEFFVGIYLCLLYKSQVKPAFIRRMKGYCTISGVAALLLIIFLLMHIATSMNTIYGKTAVSGALVNNFLLPPAIGLFLYGLLTETSALRTLLETKIFQLLGKSSYAFYLIHMGFVQIFLRRYVIDIPVITLIILLMLSALLFLFVEEPLNNLIKKTAGKKKVNDNFT